MRSQLAYMGVLVASSASFTTCSTSIRPSVSAFLLAPPNAGRFSLLSLAAVAQNGDDYDGNDDGNDVDGEGMEDTIRVRIWKALASGEELTLKQLGAAVGEHKDLKAHLTHVEKQAKTLKNKSITWRQRRGLPTDNVQKNNKLSLKMRRGNKKELYVKLD
jgi:hypothetical protein